MSCMIILSKFANHQNTHKVGCQPGDCIILLIFLRGLYGFTVTLSAPKGKIVKILLKLLETCQFYYAALMGA